MNWYNGQYNVRALLFDECHLTYINSNMFNSEAFFVLAFLAFNDNVGALEFKFDYSPELLELSFMNTHMRNIDENFLQPMFHIVYVTIVYLPPNVTLNHLFGSEGTSTYQRLGNVNIHGSDSNITRYLHADNFTQLTYVHILVLVDLNIDRIHPKAFDAIGATLSRLNLTGNKLKFLEFNWFGVFFDKSEFEYWKILQFAHNPLNCSCDFYAIRNFSNYISAGSEEQMGQQDPLCQGQDTDVPCDHQQTISREKLLLTDSRIAVFAYPKVKVHIENGFLMLKTSFTSKMRVLILCGKTVDGTNNIKCPKTMSSRSAVSGTCLLFASDSKSMNVIKLLQDSKLAMFFVILTHPRKLVWPLHIQTIRWAVDNNINPIGIVLMSCMGGWILGIIICFCYLKCNNGKNAASQNALKNG